MRSWVAGKGVLEEIWDQDFKNAFSTFVRHINPLMFDVIDDKPEGFIMYKHEPVGRGFIHYHINHDRVYVL